MNTGDQTWLENRIYAAVGDDFYLDRDEEKRIKEESSARGILVNDIERVLRLELEKYGAVSERILLDELERLLHQFTDNDKYLDAKEERNALDKVLIPTPKKKKGLDPRVAKEYVDSFCQVNGVRRTGSHNWFIPAAMVGVLVLLGIVAVYFLLPRQAMQTVKIVDSGSYSLSSQDCAEIDDLYRRAVRYVEQSQYTDPPEKSAKASLDSIKIVDPQGQYRGAEITALIDKIVNQYIALAQKSYNAGDKEGTKKWLERARLFNKNSEQIREKEREFGIIEGEK
ncbi:MAG: hypothetical protein AAB110_02335 [Candidatus Desantisbacteria bacterium]